MCCSWIEQLDFTSFSLLMLTLCVIVSTDKRRLAGCPDSFVSDIAHRRSWECPFGHLQLNRVHLLAPSPHRKHGLILLYTVLYRGVCCPAMWRGTAKNPPLQNNLLLYSWTFGIQNYKNVTNCNQRRCLYRFHILFRGLGLLIHS